MISSLLLHYSSLNVPHERLECLPWHLLLQEPGTTIFVLSSPITCQEVLSISASQLCYLSIRKATITVGFTSLLYPSLHVLDPQVLTALIVFKQIFFFFNFFTSFSYQQASVLLSEVEISSNLNTMLSFSGMSSQCIKNHKELLNLDLFQIEMLEI